MLHNYPEEWTRAFSQLNFHCIDPVFHLANQRYTPFFWDSEAFRADLTPVQRGILAEAQRFGVAHGYTVPIHPPRASYAFRGSCSVVPDSASLDMASFFAVQLMGVYMYEALSRQSQQARPLPPCLTRRERQCLELAAQGKSDWAAGRILGISERTVHNHIEHAKRRLGVATRVQAIVQALVSRQISFGDVIRSAGPD
jgi:DNA-binding CsgD family transcriptional regulator